MWSHFVFSFSIVFKIESEKEKCLNCSKLSVPQHSPRGDYLAKHTYIHTQCNGPPHKGTTRLRRIQKILEHLLEHVEFQICQNLLFWNSKDNFSSILGGYFKPKIGSNQTKTKTTFILDGSTYRERDRWNFNIEGWKSKRLMPHSLSR